MGPRFGSDIAVPVPGREAWTFYRTEARVSPIGMEHLTHAVAWRSFCSTEWNHYVSVPSRRHLSRPADPVRRRRRARRGVAAQPRALRDRERRPTASRIPGWRAKSASCRSTSACISSKSCRTSCAAAFLSSSASRARRPRRAPMLGARGAIARCRRLHGRGTGRSQGHGRADRVLPRARARSFRAHHAAERAAARGRGPDAPDVAADPRGRSRDRVREGGDAAVRPAPDADSRARARVAARRVRRRGRTLRHRRVAPRRRGLDARDRARGSAREAHGRASRGRRGAACGTSSRACCRSSTCRRCSAGRSPSTCCTSAASSRTPGSAPQALRFDAFDRADVDAFLDDIADLLLPAEALP